MNDQSSAMVRQEFNGTAIQKQPDTAATAMAARSKAMIEARCIMAIQRPRNWDVVRTRLLDECKRPGFAAAARYHKPIGKGVEGPSIRFAEAAIRYMTNLAVETTVTYDDDKKLILRVSVTDLESNVPFEQDVVIAKTVERKKLGRGQTPLSQRTNSYGDLTYLVEATDEEILNKQNALVSKALRTLALRLLPGDILDECMSLCIATAQNENAQDPAAARKKLVDAFHSVGVDAERLVEYLGHPLTESTPAELTTLRAIYSALRDGETTWREIMDERFGGADEKPAPSGAKAKAQSIIDASKSKTKADPKPDAPTASTREPGEEG